MGITQEAAVLTGEQRAMINGLRHFADFLERNPVLNRHPGTFYECHYCSTGEELAETARSVGGRWERRVDDEGRYFHLERRFGPVTFALYTNREHVCKPAVKTVLVPDLELLAGVELAGEPEPEFGVRVGADSR